MLLILNDVQRDIILNVHHDNSSETGFVSNQCTRRPTCMQKRKQSI